MEHDLSFQRTCDRHNEKVNDVRYFDACGFPKHQNVEMFPKHNSRGLLLGHLREVRNKEHRRVVRARGAACVMEPFCLTDADGCHRDAVSR